MERKTNAPLVAHLSMMGACVFWGLMSPVGKDAMLNGIDGISMVSFRVLGGAVLFLAASLFAPREHVPLRDVMLFLGAAVLGLVCNQCCFIIGLSITSPINASVITTTMPLFSMLFAALILREPMTLMKVSGVLLGFSGALLLIFTSLAAGNSKVGALHGDLLCLCAQISYSLYLSLFNRLIKRYSVFTINKWMFLWASVLIVPFTAGHLTRIPYAMISSKVWLETSYVVVVGTFVCYLLMMVGQRTLRPTVVSSYNYLQPIVAVAVSIAASLGILKWSQFVAVVFVFAGVWLVSKSKSRRDMQRQ